MGESRDAGFPVTTSGEAYAFGENAQGDLGIGSTKNQKTPMLVSTLSDVKQVAGGANHTLFLLDDGTVYGAGSNKQGQLGLGKVSQEKKPTRLPGLTGIVEISAGQDESYARNAEGTVWASGLNSHGQMCVGSSAHAITAFTALPLAGPASQISGGGDLNSDGTVAFMVEGVPYACGDDSHGQVGDGETEDKPTPVVMSELLEDEPVEVVEGGESVVFRSAPGEAYTLGNGELGALGNGGETSSFAPLPVQSDVLEVSSVARKVLVLQE
jgi:alpha-tubulin suppressor-like RCC1 family protein